MRELIQVALAGVLLGLLYALVAAGLNLVFGVFEILNIAHGEFVFGGAYVSWFIWDAWGWHPFLTVPFAAAAMFVVGVVLQAVLIERVLKESIVVSLILLFGVSLAVQGLGVRWFSVNARTIDYFQGSWEIGGVIIAKSRLSVALVAVPVLVLMHLYLKHTRLGVATKATAQNAQIAEACGINVKRVRYLTMGLGAAMAGVAGSLVISVLPFNPQTGYQYAVIAFVVAVVGGLGSFYGSIAAAIVLGAGQNILAKYTDQQLSFALIYFFLIAILIIRPSGLASLFPSRTRAAVGR